MNSNTLSAEETLEQDGTSNSPENITTSSSDAGIVGPGRWIEKWIPENQAFWESKGRAIANRNLWFSILAENIGFSVCLLWSIVVVKMYGTVDASGTLIKAGANGWALTAGQGLTLLAV